MTAFDLYLLLKLDSIRTLLFGAWVLGLLAIPVHLAVAGMLSDIAGDPDEKAAKHVLGLIKSYGLVFIFIGFTSITVRALTPTTREMAAIYIIPRVVNNEQVQAIGENGLKILEAYTKELLEDITPVVKREEAAK